MSRKAPAKAKAGDTKAFHAGIPEPGLRHDGYWSNLMSAVLQNLVNQPYKHGFVTDIESDIAPKGLNEDIIRLISTKKNEPEWLLEFRLNAYRQWLTMKEPKWPNVKYPKIDFQAISYYAAPKPKKK